MPKFITACAKIYQCASSTRASGFSARCSQPCHGSWIGLASAFDMAFLVATAGLASEEFIATIVPSSSSYVQSSSSNSSSKPEKKGSMSAGPWNPVSLDLLHASYVSCSRADNLRNTSLNTSFGKSIASVTFVTGGCRPRRNVWILWMTFCHFCANFRYFGRRSFDFRIESCGAEDGAAGVLCWSIDLAMPVPAPPVCPVAGERPTF
jgi:hypothetical protein